MLSILLCLIFILLVTHVRSTIFLGVRRRGLGSIFIGLIAHIGCAILLGWSGSRGWGCGGSRGLSSSGRLGSSSLSTLVFLGPCRGRSGLGKSKSGKSKEETGNQCNFFHDPGSLVI